MFSDPFKMSIFGSPLISLLVTSYAFTHIACRRKHLPKIFPVNRAILAAVSTIFKVTFTKRWEVNCNRRTVNIDLPSHTLNLLLEYAYTGHCDVTRKNVATLLAAADQFEFDGVVKRCCDFLEKELTDVNCVGILQFGKTYFIESLEDIAMRYIRRHFKDVMTYSYFNNLTEQELRAILSHDELNVRYEEYVFEAIVQWIDHDVERREKHFTALSECVRYGLLDERFLSDSVLSNPYVKGNNYVNDTVASVIVDMKGKSGEDVDLTLPICRPRVPHEVVFTLGGWSEGAPTRIVETYDTRADRWIFSRTEIPVNRAYHGLCVVHNLIYVVGGMDGNHFYNSVRSYDPVTHLWAIRSCMHQARAYVSVVALNNLVYAFGGFNGQVRLSSAERYVPSENQWYLIASMRHRRSDASATILYEKIYIAGGFTGEEILRSAEMYDPVINQWTNVRPMQSLRSGVGLVAYRNLLYAIGGFDGSRRLKTVECLNPLEGKDWQKVTRMFSARSNFATVVLDEMIFVIGGYDGHTTTSFVECYDSATRKWYAATSLVRKRSALGACVVEGLPNVREYTFRS